jgi:hypothetical protein
VRKSLTSKVKKIILEERVVRRLKTVTGIN